jgi:hypothetical protein
MDTKRIWLRDMERRDAEERRGGRRVAANFYAIELAGGARYLRRVANVSPDGLLMENPLADELPGQIVELALPLGKLSGNDNGGTDESAGAGSQAEEDEGREIRVLAEVVYVTADGHVGLRVTSEPLPVDELGGQLPL